MPAIRLLGRTHIEMQPDAGQGSAGQSWNIQGLSRPVMGLLYLYLYYVFMINALGYAMTHLVEEIRCQSKRPR
jgi:hypothetical protein